MTDILLSMILIVLVMILMSSDVYRNLTHQIRSRVRKAIKRFLSKLKRK